DYSRPPGKSWRPARRRCTTKRHPDTESRHAHPPPPARPPAVHFVRRRRRPAGRGRPRGPAAGGQRRRGPQSPPPPRPPPAGGRGAKGDEGGPRVGERCLRGEMSTAPPMTGELSGLKVEYALALIYSTEAGKREATIAFDVGQGSQDLGFRAEVPVLFDVKPGVPVKLSVLDFDGKPTVGRVEFTDAAG